MILPNNIWWLSRSPPHVFIFQANLRGPPLDPSKVFSDPPFWVLSYDWFPLLFFWKSSDPPKKILRPPPHPLPQAINNDRSLNGATPNWLEANQLASYKRGRGFEPWIIENKSSWQSGRSFNLGPPKCKSNALMAQSRCLLSLIFWETAHLPLP